MVQLIAVIFLALLFIPYAYLSLPFAWVVLLPFKAKLSCLAQWERRLLFGLSFLLVSLLVLAVDIFALDQMLGRNVNTPMFQFLAMQAKELSNALRELTTEVRTR